MRAYSKDLRQKIVRSYESGEGTLDEVAATFDVGRRTVARLMKLWRAGDSLAPKPHGGGYPSSLDNELLALLRQQVVQEPDATLAELSCYLQAQGEVKVHPATVCRALQRLGLPRKKKPGGRRTRRTAQSELSPRGGGHQPPSLRLYRRNRLSFSHDTPLWTCSARAKSEAISPP